MKKLILSILIMIFSSAQAYTAKDFSHLYEMKDFKRELLQMHFILYRGYVKNANFLLNELDLLAKSGKGKSYEFGALKRRLGWEMDGMRLHELYFSNLGGKGEIVNEKLLYAIEKDFGHMNAWKNDFMDTGKIRGIGWVVLYRDPDSGKLINMWINEHDTGHLAGGDLLIVMDVWEHAYITQFGLDRAKYIEAFFNNINWEEVNERYLRNF